MQFVSLHQLQLVTPDCCPFGAAPLSLITNRKGSGFSVLRGCAVCLSLFHGASVPWPASVLLVGAGFALLLDRIAVRSALASICLR
jgi:hypothetical protein